MSPVDGWRAGSPPRRLNLCRLSLAPFRAWLPQANRNDAAVLSNSARVAPTRRTETTSELGRSCRSARSGIGAEHRQTTERSFQRLAFGKREFRSEADVRVWRSSDALRMASCSKESGVAGEA